MVRLRASGRVTAGLLVCETHVALALDKFTAQSAE